VRNSHVAIRDISKLKISSVARTRAMAYGFFPFLRSFTMPTFPKTIVNKNNGVRIVVNSGANQGRKKYGPPVVYAIGPYENCSWYLVKISRNTLNKLWTPAVRMAIFVKLFSLKNQSRFMLNNWFLKYLNFSKGAFYGV